MNHVNKRYGFTLIELMLAMGFVSVLLIAIAMTVIQVGNIYNRGLTLKDVNQAGRSITSELQRDINSTTPFDLSKMYKIQGDVSKPSGGRLCTGQYSYVWNYGWAINTNNAFRNEYSNSSNQIHFIKILDPTSGYCTDSTTKINFDNAIELLEVGQSNLAIHSFTIASNPTASDNKISQQLYNIDFMIGTNDTEAILDDLSSCKPPSDVSSNLNYCAINQFDITVRAGNRSE